MGQVNDVCHKPCVKSGSLEHGHLLSPNNIAKKKKNMNFKGKYRDDEEKFIY